MAELASCAELNASCPRFYWHMVPGTSPLPFSIAGVHGGFSSAGGLARLSPDGLVLEYQVNLLTLFRLPVRELSIPFAEITSVTLHKTFLQTKITLQTSSLRTLAAMPGHKTGQIQLRIARQHRETAARLVSALRLYLSEQALHRLDPNWQTGLPWGEKR